MNNNTSKVKSSIKKKDWKKPKLVSGKEIGFLGLQSLAISDTGFPGDPTGFS